MPTYKNRYKTETVTADTKVWRYLSLDALIATIQKRQLRLTRIDAFKDPFKGSVTAREMLDLVPILSSNNFGQNLMQFIASDPDDTWLRDQRPLENAGIRMTRLRRAQRCDNEGCTFYVEPLVWNGKPLRLILDHRNGVNSDNRVSNLQLLCPNCNSQSATLGGANRGRVRKSAGGFCLVNPDGHDAYVLPLEPIV